MLSISRQTYNPSAYNYFITKTYISYNATYILLEHGELDNTIISWNSEIAQRLLVTFIN